MLHTQHGMKTIDEFVGMYRSKRLNLSPAFQRQSVWNVGDRRLLIQSLLERVPLPSIYLYRHVGPGGAPRYEVIDGKQRLETILLFLGKGPLVGDEPLWVRHSFDEGALDWWRWGEFGKKEKNEFLTTNIATIEVEGDLGEIIDLFVRINATGKSLTGQEKRHARYYSNPVLKTAQRVAEEIRPFLLTQNIVSSSQAQRMKHVELVTELLLAMNAGVPLNKKSKIDEIIRGAGVQSHELTEAVADLRRALKIVTAVLPDLKTTRFRNTTDFYTLVLLLHRFKEEGKAVSAHDGQRNSLAGGLLREFGRGVDEINDQLRHAKNIDSHQEPFREYLLTVRADTDSYKQRITREKLLRNLLDHVFEDRDSCRLFNSTQRRVVWHSSASKRCVFCQQPVKRWEDMAVDHVKPHSRGGKTEMANAAVSHKSCNSKAGAKRKR